MTVYRKIGALIIRDHRMLLITATMDPDVYSMPGGPDCLSMTHNELIAEALHTELGVDVLAYAGHFGDYHVTSDIDGSGVFSTIYRVEIDGEPEPRQLGRRLVWANPATDVRMSTTVQAVMADAVQASLVETGNTT